MMRSNFEDIFSNFVTLCPVGERPEKQTVKAAQRRFCVERSGASQEQNRFRLDRLPGQYADRAPAQHGLFLAGCAGLPRGERGVLGQRPNQQLPSYPVTSLKSVCVCGHLIGHLTGNCSFPRSFPPGILSRHTPGIGKLGNQTSDSRQLAGQLAASAHTGGWRTGELISVTRSDARAVTRKCTRVTA